MRSTFLVVVLFISCFFSCSEFVDYPLEKKTVDLIGPVDSLSTIDTTLTFLWEPHEDATSYRLQIATPDFESIQRIAIDTVVSKDYVELNLQPGQYHWRVRPENRGSVGIYSSRQFKILAQ
ncbi:hypothetical protein LZQ00_10035 [Sphingobacterium sp. SRCM116780]|uniref:hypothetical protein n=1 Tax=Sphingobacterium sp. SRCM116780 TaxID=2907623 RepID=UPI001F44FD68|nr:hypothetical protein [Sphingobacterium sp. SRCM116780]UIR54613.1 hypothetical protein LZQ00_10035 [Sphingobacterium sp. SRCM116780]